MSSEAVIPDSRNSLPDEIKQVLQTEVEALRNTHASLDEQLKERGQRFNRERARSRELTSEMIATRRDEDRYQLASDEAVSHALTAQHDESLQTLRTLKERPYFARVILEEEEDSGAIRTVEYKIGYAANPACRIIDWRRAPLSKLYYEYREGDEYSEEILGRERFGTVKLRNRVEIQKGDLKQVTCRHGTFFLNEDGWSSSSAKQGGRDFGALPEVLSLISPEQFRAITTEAGSAVLIQGVAGSGKTTVALHRLSWLLEAANSDLKAEDCVVLTLGPSLREYIKSSLAALEISSVPVQSYREWCSRQLKGNLPAELSTGENGEPVLATGAMRAPAGVERVKRSIGLLRALETIAAKEGATTTPLELLLTALSNARLIRENDETKLLDDALIRSAYERTADLKNRGVLDRSDFSLLLRCIQLTTDPIRAAGRTRAYHHVVIDEVQDYSPIELATVLSAVDSLGNLTLVGDTAQRVEEGFPGWDKLRRWWTAKKLHSSFVRLEVSHRSTKQIVACAAALGSVEPPRGGRTGELPQWMFAKRQEEALAGTLDWLRNVTQASPNALVGVLCFNSSDVREAYSLLSPSFGPLVRIGDEASFSFDEGIIICEAYAAKGLEFHAVLVWQPVSTSLPRGDVGRHLMYIASTRAQNHLAFATWGGIPSPLSALPNQILDRVDLDVDYEEEEEPVEEDRDD